MATELKLESDLYFERLEDFKSILHMGLELFKKLPEKDDSEIALQYCFSIFNKILSHGLSLHKIIPSKERKPGFYWDISSMSALSRCIMEAYDALAYIALHPITETERKFRALLWTANDFDRRLKMFRTFPDYETASATVVPWHAEAISDLENSDFFRTLDAKSQRKILNDLPPFHNTQAERNKISGINNDYYRMANLMLSQHVHTYSFSIHHLQSHAPETEIGYRNLNVALTHALSFTARAISEISEIYLPNEKFTNEAQKIIDEYLSFSQVTKAQI